MTVDITRIETEEAPKAAGPYSQAVSVKISEAEWIFVSGQVPIDFKTNKILNASIADLTRQTLNQIEAILRAQNATLQNIVRVEVFLTDLKYFQEMNEEYRKIFSWKCTPARQTVQVAGLPMDSPLEISCIAIKKN
jgi:2-iminobutanoate/2-iminopropanoate deaminase